MSSDTRKEATTQQLNLHVVGLSVFLILLVCLTFLPVFTSGIIWDDYGAVRDNPLLHTANGLYRIWFSPSSLPLDGHYYPLLFTSYWIEYQFFGLNYSMFHAVNLCLHLMNAFLLWRVLYNLSIPGAWISAAVWAIHPLNVETVAWIYEQKNTQSLFFMLLVILCWIQLEKKWNWRNYILMVVLFACAVLTKVFAVSLSVNLLVLHWYLSGKVKRWAIFAVLPMIFISLAAGLFDMYLFGQRGESDYGTTILQHVLLTGRTFCFYFEKMLLPFNLMAIYPRWSLSPTQFELWICLFTMVITFMGVAYGWLRCNRGLTAAFLFYCLTMSPISGIIEYNYFGTAYVADHLVYHASIAIVALVGASLVWVFQKKQWNNKFLYLLVVMLLSTYSVLSYRHALIYQSAETLFTDNLRKNPQAFKAHLSLAYIRQQQGRIDESIDHYQKAIDIEPRYGRCWSYLSWSLYLAGKDKEALEASGHALSLASFDGRILHNHAYLLAGIEGPESALPYYQKAFDKLPGDSGVILNLAITHQELKQTKPAMELVEEYERLMGETTQSRLIYGLILSDIGDTEKAEKVFKQVLNQDPTIPDTVYNAGKVAEENGLWQLAIDRYSQVFLLDSNHLYAMNNLAWVLATTPEEHLRDSEKALLLASKVNDSTGGNNPGVLDTLAAAHAANNDFVSAIEIARKAEKLASSPMKERISNRIDLYEKGQIYTE